MEATLLQLLPNLGLAGFAMFILWKQFESSQKRSKEKDEEFISYINSKDRSFIDEMAKKDHLFRELEKEVRHSVMKQLADNTNAWNKVLKHFDDRNS